MESILKGAFHVAREPFEGKKQPLADKQGPKGLSPLAAYGIYGAAGLQLAASVVGCLLLGDFVDKKFGTSPWLAITGLVVGFVGGLVNLIRIVRRINIGSEPKDKE
jgi:hypothetical protein